MIKVKLSEEASGKNSRRTSLGAKEAKAVRQPVVGEYDPTDDTKIRVKINCTVDGLSALMIKDLWRRGFISSTRDAVMQGIVVLYNSRYGLGDDDLEFVVAQALRRHRSGKR